MPPLLLSVPAAAAFLGGASPAAPRRAASCYRRKRYTCDRHRARPSTCEQSTRSERGMRRGEIRKEDVRCKEMAARRRRATGSSCSTNSVARWLQHRKAPERGGAAGRTIRKRSASAAARTPIPSPIPAADVGNARAGRAHTPRATIPNTRLSLTILRRVRDSCVRDSCVRDSCVRDRGPLVLNKTCSHSHIQS